MRTADLARLGRVILAADLRWSRALADATARHAPLHRSAVWVAHLGDGIVWIGVGLVAWLLGEIAVRRVVAQAALATVLAAALVLVLKLLVRRSRPPVAGRDLYATLTRWDAYAFPSGHAARMACIATCVSVAHPRLLALCVIAALAIATARVARAAHHFLDVAAGLLLGWSIARLVLLIWPLLAARLG